MQIIIISIFSRGTLPQRYPPGTQEKYNSFQSKMPVIKDGMKPEITERWGGGKGEPWVPPR
jgi:hypothetical protein